MDQAGVPLSNDSLIANATDAIREAIVINAPVEPISEAGGAGFAVGAIIFSLFAMGMLLWGGIKTWRATVEKARRKRRKEIKKH